MYKIFFICIAIFVSCNNGSKTNCASIAQGKYSGNAIVLFYKPISGSTYEVLILPICKEVQSNDVSEYIKNIKVQKGISTGFPSRNRFFEKIFLSSTTLPLVADENLNSVFKSINIAKVYIHLKNAKNYTPEGLGDSSGYINQELTLKDRSKINLSYYWTEGIKIDSLAVFPFK